MKRLGFRVGVGRFVAGENLDSAMAVLAGLHGRGFLSVLDLLGEFLDTEQGVDDMMSAILQTIGTLGQQPFERHLSVKPTQLGLGLSPELGLANAREVARRAAAVDTHVCLDMENHPYTDGTLHLFRTLQQEGFTNVSTVLQSYLHRSPDDMHVIAREFPGAQVRIVKGAYREPASVAHQDLDTIRSAFLDMTKTALEAGMHVNVATHDEQLIVGVLDQVRALATPPSGYELQFLYGIKPRLQERLKAEGHAVRIYVPFGQDWYGYFSRRLAERPANLGMVIRGFFG